MCMFPFTGMCTCICFSFMCCLKSVFLGCSVQKSSNFGIFDSEMFVETMKEHLNGPFLLAHQWSFFTLLSRMRGGSRAAGRLLYSDSFRLECAAFLSWLDFNQLDGVRHFELCAVPLLNVYQMRHSNVHTSTQKHFLSKRGGILC